MLHRLEHDIGVGRPPRAERQTVTGEDQIVEFDAPKFPHASTMPDGGNPVTG